MRGALGRGEGACDHRPEIACAHTRAQPSCSAAHPRSGRDRASPTRRWQPRAWQLGRKAWPLHRAFLCGRLAAEPYYPLSTAPRAAPAARACPFTANRARPSASPDGARSPWVLWLHHGRPNKDRNTFVMVFRPTVGRKRSVTVEAKCAYGRADHSIDRCYFSQSCFDLVGVATHRNPGARWSKGAAVIGDWWGHRRRPGCSSGSRWVWAPAPSTGGTNP